MTTARTLEPEWIDLSGDLERIEKDAREAWRLMGIVPHDEYPSWYDESSDATGFTSSGVVGGGHRAGLASGLPNPGGGNVSHGLMPGMNIQPHPVVPSHEYYGGYFGGGGNGENNYLSKQESMVILPPRVDPPLDYRGYLCRDGNEEDDHFLSSGTNSCQPTYRSIDGSAQVAETSTSLALAKPNYIDNNNQSEADSPAASSSGGSYDRTQNKEGKDQYLARIRKELKIPKTKDELYTLREVISHLGGTVPTHEAPIGSLNKSERQGVKLAEISGCYETIREIVGPQSGKLRDLVILQNALARITSRSEPQSSGGENQPFAVFRAFKAPKNPNDRRKQKKRQ